MSFREALVRVWANPYVRVAFALAVLYVAVQIFLMVQPAGALFVAGIGLAYLLNPVVDWLQRRRIHRGFGVALVAVALVAIIWLITSFSLIAIRNTVSQTDGDITLSEAATQLIEDLPLHLERLLPVDLYMMVDGYLERFGELLRQGGRALAPYVEGVGAQLVGVVSGTVAGLAVAVFVVVLTVYALYDFHRLSAALLLVWPKPYQERVHRLAGTLDQVFGGYIRGQVVVAIAVGLMVFIGLTIIRLPLAGFIGLLAGLLNIVPFLGTIVPVIPALVIALGSGWLQAFFVVVVFTIANQIDNHVVTPMVLSNATRLHPVTVMLAVIGGFAAGGLLLAILAVPIVAFVKSLYTEHYLKSPFYEEG
jgi:predicted PurR-regulated permease PerM